jgi:hypothetical protein
MRINYKLIDYDLIEIFRSRDKPLNLRMSGSFAPTGPYEGTIMLGCIEDETGRYYFRLTFFHNY